jgi:hypothetical protein
MRAKSAAITQIGYVRATVNSALMLKPTEGDDLPACLCAD